MYHKLQYISQGNTAAEHVDNIRQALEGGCRWIQLRMKDLPDTEAETAACAAAGLCLRYDAIFIVNDHVELALRCGAHGVHLGLTDMPVDEARRKLGPGMIIGGTANTAAQVEQRISEGCSYIGLGPFRFTSTKKNLSPVLGINGYNEILSQPAVSSSSVPVYAIGGIMPDDVSAILGTGVHGVAVSGVITNSADRTATIQQFNTLLYEKA